MRIDKFCKLSRIIKRRTEAKKACDEKCVKINDQFAKAGDPVKPFDKIEIFFRNRFLFLEVLEIPEGNVSISRAKELYRIIKDEKRDRGSEI